MGYLACFVSGLILGILLMTHTTSASIRDVEDRAIKEIEERTKDEGEKDVH